MITDARPGRTFCSRNGRSFCTLLVSSVSSMDQAGRIIAGMKGGTAIASPERIACAAWKRAVGKRLALRTKPVKLVRDRLVVEVEDEIWRESLWKLRFQILRNIEKEIGAE